MSWNAIKAGKELALRGARGLGVYSAVKHRKLRRQQVLILAYHGISQHDEHLWRPGLYITPELFASRMEAIAAFGCNVLPLDEAFTLLRTGNLPPLSVVITFDDGYYDFYRLAFPILKRHNFPATVYQTTFFSCARKPVFNLVRSYVLWKGAGKEIDGEPFLGRKGSIHLRTQADIDTANREIWQFARSNGLCSEQRQHLVERLAEALGVDYAEISNRRMFELMTKDELAEMVRQGVDFQLHTHRHRVPLDKALFLKELDDNKRVLEEVGQRNAAHFAYPSGVYQQEMFPWLLKFGVRSATTCESGLATRQLNPVCLPRLLDAPNISGAEFEAWLCGLRGFLPRRQVSSS